MTTKKTNEKRQLVSHTVQPVVGDGVWDIKKIDIGTESDGWLKAEVFNAQDLECGKFSISASENTGEGDDVFCSYGNDEKRMKRTMHVSIEDMPLRFAVRLRDFLNYAIPNPGVHPSPAASAGVGGATHCSMS